MEGSSDLIQGIIPALSQKYEGHARYFSVHITGTQKVYLQHKGSSKSFLAVHTTSP
jgi:hypothetical protein